jgi:hypothetical protein
MLNVNDTLPVSASTNGSVADMPDGKLTYPLAASSSSTDSASDPAAATQGVAPTADDTNTLRVGPEQAFGSLSEAIAASKQGDTILLEAGTYESDYSTISHPLTIRGVGGLAHLKAVDPIPNGKAILVVNADVTVENIMFTDARVPDQNGAGIRHESGDLVIRNNVFQNNENGILSAPNAAASVTIRDSEFIGNGYGDGRSHGIYVNQIARLDVEGSTFRDTKVGHHIKSRAQETTVRDSILDDGQGDASYSIDLPNGGRAILEDNTLTQTSLSENPAMVAYGAEGNLHSQNSLLIKNNTFIDNHGNGKEIYNHTDTAVTLQGNTFQDVETEVVGSHQFIDEGAANPAGDDGTTSAEDTTNDSLADDGLADDGSTTDELAGGSVNGSTTTAEDTTDSGSANDEAVNEDLASNSGANDEATNDNLADDGFADNGLASNGLADNNNANDGLLNDVSVESANNLTNAPDEAFPPRDLFRYTTKSGDSGRGSDFSDLFVNDHNGRFVNNHDGRDGAGSDGSAGDWWFDFY